LPGLVQWWHVNPDASHVAVAFGAGEHPPIMPGESSTITIGADRGVNHLSVASMLICTNVGRGEHAVLCSASTRDRNPVEPCLHLKKSSVSNVEPRKCAGSDFCALAT